MKLSRRWVLRGLGATVAIPVLPSLLTAKEAAAQEAQAPLYFVSYGTRHGNISSSNMFPAMSATAETRTYAGRTIRRSPLVPTIDGADAVLSNVLRAKASIFTERLRSQLHVARGFDILSDLQHHSAGSLGNFGSSSSEFPFGDVVRTNGKRVTIDQLIGYSPSFYPSLEGVRERALVLSTGVSSTWTNPATRTGVQTTRGYDTPSALFTALFGAATEGADGGVGRELLVVDKVMEEYRLLKASPRLSGQDKDRLEQHLQRLFEVERQLEQSRTVPAGCAVPMAPTAPNDVTSIRSLETAVGFSKNPAQQISFAKTINDLVVAAFSCGLSRIAVGTFTAPFTVWAGSNWHQDVAHKTESTTGQQALLECYRTFFAECFVDLASKLDAVRLPSGKTMLDQALVTWMHEHGSGKEHRVRDFPVVGIGGAGGAMQGGSFVDYRNLERDVKNVRPGMVWQQYLGTILQVMRVPKTEWENPSVNQGYPDFNTISVSGATAAEVAAGYGSAWAVAGEKLPWLTT